MTVEQVATELAEWVKSVATQPWMFLALSNIALLLLDTFIEPLPAKLISASSASFADADLQISTWSTLAL